LFRPIKLSVVKQASVAGLSALLWVAWPDLDVSVGGPKRIAHYASPKPSLIFAPVSTGCETVRYFHVP